MRVAIEDVDCYIFNSNISFSSMLRFRCMSSLTCSDVLMHEERAARSIYSELLVFLCSVWLRLSSYVCACAVGPVGLAVDAFELSAMV